MSELCMVEDYGDGTISFWITDMDEADRSAIDQILYKYADKGYSCRGLPEPVLSELATIYNKEG